MATTDAPKAIGMGSINPTPRKSTLSLRVRVIDNGYILTVDKDTPDGYQTVELAITSLPKLLKSIGIFLKEAEKKVE
jgi:hypothetical protein